MHESVDNRLMNDDFDDMLESAFDAEFSDNFPGILSALNICIIGSSFQADKLFTIRESNGQIDVNLTAMERPMGITADELQITVGCENQVVRLTRNDAAMMKFEEAELPIDACFIPNLVHYTGMINIHDIAYGNDGLWVTNSNFSCLALIETGYSFVPKWKPSFVRELKATDKCHLNGMAMQDGMPAYVSCFQAGDEDRGWRQDSSDGVIVEVATQRIVADKLCMPHSPKCWNGDLYYCESGTGHVWKWSPKEDRHEKVLQLPGYTRGMRFFGPLLFIATSVARYSDIKKAPPLLDMFEETVCAIWVVNTETFEVVASLQFNGGIEQIYDLEIIHNVSFPELIENDSSLIGDVFGFPPMD